MASHRSTKAGAPKVGAGNAENGYAPKFRGC